LSKTALDLQSETALRDVADEVLNLKNKPEDQYEVAAILESIGWTDQRAEEVFGFSNVFDMAKHVWKTIRMNVVFNPFTPMSKIKFTKYPLKFIRYFLKGSIFAIPMAISVFSMLTIRFSLWSYESFNTEIATAIAIGTILSFLSIGGFTQAIAKQGYGYIKQGYYGMAKLTTFFFVRLGYFLSISVVLIMVVGNLLLGVFPYRMLIIIVLYYFILNAIWLSVTIMYILSKELLFSGLLILGISIIYVLFRIMKIDIIVAQLISLSIVALLGAVIAFLIFMMHSRKYSQDEILPKLPKKTIILNSVVQYFLYGFAYFAFLFADRVVAWSTNDIYMPYIIWFRGEYELGLDFALLILIIPMGFVEFIVNSMMISIEGTQKEYYVYEVDKMVKRYKRLYISRVVLMFAISLVSGLLIHWLVKLIQNNYFPFIDIGISPITYFVFIVAMVGYAFTAMSLLNIEILFCVTQPKMTTKAVLPALFTTVLVGFLLSRWIHHSYAVFGLAAGAVVFFVISTILVVRVLKKIDFYLYAAT
jgi:hypothetical protein